MLTAVRSIDEMRLTCTERNVSAARALDSGGVHDWPACLPTRSALANRGLLGNCPALGTASTLSFDQQKARHHCTIPQVSSATYIDPTYDSTQKRKSGKRP